MKTTSADQPFRAKAPVEMKLMTYAASIAVMALCAPLSRAHAFDDYVNPILQSAVAGTNVKALRQLTPELIADHDHVLDNMSAALVIVQTNEGRLSKLLVQAARRKIAADKTVPILLIDRFVTYREGEERAIQAAGNNVNLFGGFHLSLDIGQVVPPQLGGDVRFVVDRDKQFLEPLGRAKLYLLTKALPEAKPKKDAKVVIGATFEPRYFTGTYKLYDDGRRSGTLKLKVLGETDVQGVYYSDKDGQKYDVSGTIGVPKHSIQFIIKFPQIEQVFTGWLFTGDGKALAGSSRMLTRESGFYALRVEE